MLRSFISKIRHHENVSQPPCGGMEQSWVPDLNRQVIILLVTIRDFALYNGVYGSEITDRIETELSKAVREVVDEVLPEHRTRALPSEPGEYIIAWDCSGNSQPDPADLTYAVKVRLQSALKKTMLQWTGIGMEVGVGYSLTGTNEAGDVLELPAALSEARRMASLPLELRNTRIAAEFEDILNNGRIRSSYQPILDLRKGEVHGWEALARGPRNSRLESPLMLFELAEPLGSLFRLEQLCRERAVSGLGPMDHHQKIFLNIHPKTLADPLFTPGNTLELLERQGLSPENVVFEITERQSVQDFGLFYKTLAHYRSQGFLVAVDDVGAGYSGLSAIAELQPEYIKLDKSLIHDIHRDPVKRALAETITSFADKIGSRIIAEGIENRDQAICLMDIGVHCGQGYYLGRPSRQKRNAHNNWDELKSIAQISHKMVTCSIPVGEVVEAPHAIAPDTLVSFAQDFFKRNNQFSSLVVTENDSPIGLVTEYYLNRQLSSQYGVALYYKREVTSVMDDNPLIVDATMPVEQAARLAMDRDAMKAYDEVIVVRRGKLFGTVSVQKLLDTLAKVQVEMAKGTNPLTGLPGNVAIEQELEARMQRAEQFCIIYADLDNFKVYNDSYGFRNGDRIIKLCADIITWATRKHGPSDALACHIGGDDFVIITSKQAVERTCRSIRRCFQRAVRGCYTEEDRKSGWIKAKGRDGLEREYPLVSVSMGVLEVVAPCSLMEVGERAAHIKKYAKSMPGNSVAMDRRPPLGSAEIECVEG
ncbi:GGDEF domain-containing protein [Desulfovibrio oxyclinae]|uniref:GGDEF domain-containing protein n=1 Tax=Desulfovibrio oxyclinae TaxID=63560 RepID=UPI001FE069FA|nr:bifunctional diguanylate cyclase/phosphodiesterase [Desulfovibrio oxyclinae]